MSRNLITALLVGVIGTALVVTGAVLRNEARGLLVTADLRQRQASEQLTKAEALMARLTATLTKAETANLNTAVTCLAMPAPVRSVVARPVFDAVDLVYHRNRLAEGTVTRSEAHPQ